MSRTKNVSRTMDYYRSKGYVCESVERFIPQVMIRKDLFNFIDAICICDSHIIGLQVCSVSDLNQHIKYYDTNKKIRKSLSMWLNNAKFEIWAWRKLKQKNKKGKYINRYKFIPKIVDYSKL